MINAPNLFKQQPCRAVAENPISGNVSCSLCPSPKLTNSERERKKKAQEDPKKTPEKCKRRARFPFYFSLRRLAAVRIPSSSPAFGLSDELLTKAQPNGKRTQIFIKLTWPILGYLCYIVTPNANAEIEIRIAQRRVKRP